jgi:hypothetical protein
LPLNASGRSARAIPDYRCYRVFNGTHFFTVNLLQRRTDGPDRGPAPFFHLALEWKHPFCHAGVHLGGDRIVQASRF